MRKKVKPTRPALTPAIRHIRQDIGALDWVCAGTLLKRWKLCGRSNCRCAQDPAARHGPYYEWSRRHNGRFVHSLLSAQQAQTVARAISNHKRILALLAQWRGETTRALKLQTSAK